MKHATKSLIVLIFGLIPVFLHAQNPSESPATPVFKGHWTLQLNVGATQYFGDLNKDNLFNQNIKSGFGGALGYQLSPIFGVRGQFINGKLFSIHAKKSLRLNTDFWDAGLNLTVNINEVFADYNPERFVNFYLFGGAGLTSFSSVTSNIITRVEVQKSSSRQNELNVPMGLGAEFRLGEKISLNLEYGDHLTFNDGTLDFYTGGKVRDHYSYASAGLGIKFGGPRDSDHDGVKDKDDLCPDIPGKVDLFGCPDKDNDGVADDQDDCPNVAGKLEFKGCPDTDGDGIPDKDDRCPTVAGKKKLQGCPDKDGDGIADIDDACPDEAGRPEFKGCPDTDGDGVIDKDDRCPTQAGKKELKGCPDKDSDGVADIDDKCPDVPGTIANNGCPEESKVLVNEVVHFNTDASIVIASYNQLLNKIAETMKDNPGIRVSVEGHTDSRETKLYNMRLSERRADYVITFFTERGIDPSRIVKGFFGENKPIADNSTAEGMRLNRRVEIKSVK